MIDFLKQVFNAQEVMRLAATYQRAIAVGATSVQAPVGQFYGDRSGGVKDPCGNLCREAHRGCAAGRVEASCRGGDAEGWRLRLAWQPNVGSLLLD